jgi:carboxypeptidase C (cathepsin A)
VRSLKQLAGVLIFTVVLTPGVSAQDKPQTPPAEKPVSPATKADEPPIVTHHEVRVGGRALKYTATTGFLPIKSTTGDVEARLFFMAYTLDDAGDVAKRPLMFSFNGGPGSSSVWLHLGALGPRRVKMRPDGGMPAAQ